MCSKYAFNKVPVPTLSFVLAMAFASAVLVSSTSSTVWGQQLAVEAKAKQEQAKTGSQRPAKGSDFIRVRRNADQKATAMETSIVRYEMTNADGEKVVVDLIGVVHI